MYVILCVRMITFVMQVLTGNYTQQKVDDIIKPAFANTNIIIAHRDLLVQQMKTKAPRWEEKEVITVLPYSPICWMQKARPSGKMWKE